MPAADRTALREAARAFGVVFGPSIVLDAAIVNALLIEIPHFVMERKMLLAIKRRAEQSHTAAVRREAQAEPVKTALHA